VDPIFYNEILIENMKKIILFIALFMSLACERKDVIEGPSLDELYGDFKVLEEFSATNQQVDFSIGETVVFMARFSKTVDWEIHIVGETSKAEKIITGKSKLIDDLNGLWNGSTTYLPMFKTENCIAILTIPNELYTDTLGVLINEIKLNDGFLVSDFENGVNPGWDIFKQSGADMSFFIVESDSSAQEYHYYDMGGAVAWDYLIGYIDMPASAYQEPTYPLSNNPAEVYFNVLLNKPPAINNEIVLIQFWEDDNSNGEYDPNDEDMYSEELKDLEDGWQTISIRYDELVTLVNGAPSTPAGNGIHEPHKLLNIRILFLADPATGYSQTLMDYIIFTEGQALEP
jgi:hypothetical protein